MFIRIATMGAMALLTASCASNAEKPETAQASASARSLKVFTPASPTT